jgi:hypothetical protein
LSTVELLFPLQRALRHNLLKFVVLAGAVKVNLPAPAPTPQAASSGTKQLLTPPSCFSLTHLAFSFKVTILAFRCHGWSLWSTLLANGG